MKNKTLGKMYGSAKDKAERSEWIYRKTLTLQA